jgi:UDP-N-acetylglucosamine 2-epimerase (non-hydrolysing)
MSTSIPEKSDFKYAALKRPDGLRAGSRKKILTIFGTRPEAIKLAPVIRALETMGDVFQTINITTAQHTDLLYPLVRLFGIRLDYDLSIMEHNQPLNLLCSRILVALDSILSEERPDLVLVQGDTTTAMAGALAGFHQGIPVGHVEAGLRSHNPRSPYPEEMNRRLITNLASYHFAATEYNRDTLLAEGVGPQAIFVTGNPVIDSLKMILQQATASAESEELFRATEGLRTLVLTTHRRESFGRKMLQNLRVIRRFVETHEDVALVFPVHPNPAVVRAANAILSGHARIHLIRPLHYDQFVKVLAHAWLIVSDSGGVQEEAPTLGKPLLILRENTERPEGLTAGIARLVGNNPKRLELMLEEAYEAESWANHVEKIENPFGQGNSGRRIAHIIAEVLGMSTELLERQAS